MSVQENSRRVQTKQRLQEQLNRGTKTIYVDGKPTQVPLTEKDVKRIEQEIQNIHKNIKHERSI